MSLSSCVRIFVNDCKEWYAYFHEWVWGVTCIFLRMSLRSCVHIFMNEREEWCAYFHEWVWGVVCIFFMNKCVNGVRVFMNECNELSAYFQEWVYRVVCVFSWMTVRNGMRIFRNEGAEWRAYIHEWVWGEVCVFFMNECVWSGWAYMWSGVFTPSNRRMRLVSGWRNWKSTKSTGIARWFTIGREQREVKIIDEWPSWSWKR